MKNTKVKIVIGANYGDEGKGLATRYFAQQALKAHESCLSVLYNGSCQRGHTVELKDGRRHVFHHFGSGTFDNVDTYFDEEFIVNPIIFIQEYEELNTYMKLSNCCISEKCRVATPFDMELNQYHEQLKGNSRHGSCGMGVFETRKRYEKEKFSLTYGDLIYMSKSELQKYFRHMFYSYFESQFDDTTRSKYVSSCNDVIDKFIEFLREMSTIVKIVDFNRLASNYQTIIFEGGQGLALDEGLIDTTPHLTPSHTTSKLPVIRASQIDCNDIEICYVTRSYFTRHGAGELPTECSKSNINPAICDNTNIENEFQGSIRYGTFDDKAFISRVLKDLNESSLYTSCKLKSTCMMTHLNYVDNVKFVNQQNLFECIYESRSRYAEDVIKNN